MKKQIMQFRYYSDGHGNNQPPNLTKDKLISGEAFQDIASITQLGIQTLPGVRFYLNNADASTPIIVGSTGIYELELEGISEIDNLWFFSNSLKAISENPNAYLIIDMICELRQEV